MTREQLEKANQINREIKKLEEFIYKASMVWTGKIVSKSLTETRNESVWSFFSSSYGTVSSAELKLDNEMKNKVLQVLKDKVTCLYDELAEI